MHMKDSIRFLLSPKRRILCPKYVWRRDLRRIVLWRNNSCYETSNHTWFGAVRCRFDAGLLCQRPRSNHNHYTSDYCHGAASAAHAITNDNNDAPHGWWLLGHLSKDGRPEAGEARRGISSTHADRTQD